MTIGRFARLTGLSVGTLRHYDEVGLLPPASVDPASGYRRYCRDQAGRAKTIAMLRGGDLPIEEIRQVIDDQAGDVTRDVLTRHRRRLRRQQDVLTARIRDAGAAEVVAPHEAEGMPRCSAVRDPSGNWIWLYQA
jgi:DNA-binding transcriptional MerR regulator